MADAPEALVPSPLQGPRLGASQPSANATRLVLRVWSSTRASLYWDAESALVYMLTDLVAASGGVPVDDPALGLVASFEQPAEAFRAAKRVQWSVLEFSQQQPENCLGAAILLYHATDLPRGSQDEAVSGIVALLDQAKPSQILVAAKAARLLDDIPGLELRKRVGPSLSASELERGAQELVWTTQQTQRRVQELLKQAARKVAPKAEDLPNSEPTVDISQEVSRPNSQQIHATLFPVDRPLEPALIEAVEENDPPAEPGPSRLLWWLLPAVAVLLIVAAFYFLTQSPKKPALTDNPPIGPPTALTPTGNTEPTSSSPAPTDQPKTSGDDTPSAKPIQPDRSGRSKNAPKVTDFEGFSVGEIPGLLRMAESDAGAGNYPKARSEYEIILHLDPGNAAAKQGIRKLSLSEQESR